MGISFLGPLLPGPKKGDPHGFNLGIGLPKRKKTMWHVHIQMMFVVHRGVISWMSCEAADESMLPEAAERDTG